MEIKSIVTGFLQNNTFIVSKNNKHIMIDPGFETKEIDNWLIKNKITPNLILITHGHFDHLGGAAYFQNKYNIDIYFSAEDHFYLDDPFGPLNQLELNLKLNLNLKFKYKSTIDNKNINFNDIKFTMLKTPGHTPGSTCYFFEEAKVVFTGDTLFKETIGRTDFEKGDFKKITNSIQKKLYTLKDDVIVMPGHGDSTTIAYEKNNNCMVKGK